MKITNSILLALLLSGCATRTVMPDDFAFSVDRSDDVFLVSLTNNSSMDLCLPPGIWPNSDGYTGYVQGTPILESGGTEYQYARRFSAIGHLGRPTVIAQNQTLSLELSANDFDGVDEISLDDRLIYQPSPQACSQYK